MSGGGPQDRPQDRLQPGRLAGLAVALAAALLALAWGTGLLHALQADAVAGQRWAQNALAGAIRGIKAGEPGAFTALLALAFGYGVFHAAGPGHGKLLVGSYGLAAGVSLRRLAAISVLSSLAQSTVAVAMVMGGLQLFGWTRDRMVGAADGQLAVAGHLAAAAVGLWLMWRGARGLWRQRGMAAEGPDHRHGHDHHHHDHGHDHHDHDHGHGHGTACGRGHAHGPTPDQLARAGNWREVALLVGGIAIRPCSGALILLILTWQLGIPGAGIAATYAMGVGTALVTSGVAVGAGLMRAGARTSLAGGRLAALLPGLELVLGALVLLVALQLAAAV
ncbi:nickel/cobalt transporter [Frigidibacter oleivorans]|uniref:nickel/cobalt transporter n=1 Tax=Frigidibacter oleivorans TaxID=2487129 RepID=UPI000F8CFF09|nr:hypothetical protein [Frigidibacter oleivorans]